VYSGLHVSSLFKKSCILNSFEWPKFLICLCSVGSHYEFNKGYELILQKFFVTISRLVHGHKVCQQSCLFMVMNQNPSKSKQVYTDNESVCTRGYIQYTVLPGLRK
jgi:hypothetical protein